MSALAQPAEQQELEGVLLHQPDEEPRRALCPHCLSPVIHATLKDGRKVVASMYEWLPIAECQSCRHTRRAHPTAHVRCGKCNDTGVYGTRRPAGPMLAIDVGWGDELHLRVIGPNTDRRRGEALHPIHICEPDY